MSPAAPGKRASHVRETTWRSLARYNLPGTRMTWFLQFIEPCGLAFRLRLADASEPSSNSHVARYLVRFHQTNRLVPRRLPLISARLHDRIMVARLGFVRISSVLSLGNRLFVNTRHHRSVDIMKPTSQMLAPCCERTEMPCGSAGRCVRSVAGSAWETVPTRGMWLVGSVPFVYKFARAASEVPRDDVRHCAI